MLKTINPDSINSESGSNIIAEGLLGFAQKLYKASGIKISSKKYKEYKTKLNMAAVSDKLTVEAFMGIKIFLPVIMFGLFLLIYFTDLTLQSLSLLISVPILSWYIPELMVNNKIRNRKWQMQKELPSVLNTLAIVTDSGLNLQEAIKKVCDIKKGELVKELKKMTDEVNVGVLQRDALFRLSERCQIDEISLFVFALAQALEKGASGITQVLREQASEAWDKRKNKAKELGAKASVKLFFPMLLLVFPSIMIFILGPAVVSVFKALFFRQ
jgi:tight adherence protein C